MKAHFYFLFFHFRFLWVAHTVLHTYIWTYILSCPRPFATGMVKATVAHPNDNFLPWWSMHFFWVKKLPVSAVRKDILKIGSVLKCKVRVLKWSWVGIRLCLKWVPCFIDNTDTGHVLKWSSVGFAFLLALLNIGQSLVDGHGKGIKNNKKFRNKFSYNLEHSH